MVSLRDGKSYDPSAPTPERPKRVTRRSARNSNASELATPSATFNESEPTTPQGDATSKGSKRFRHQLQLEPIADQPLGGTETHDQGLYDAASQELPDASTPSPLPKKKARTVMPVNNSTAGRKTDAYLGLIALLVVLGIGAVTVWPQHGSAVHQSAQQALVASQRYLEGLQLNEKLSAAEAFLAAASASTLRLLRAQAANAQQQLHTVLLQLHIKYPTLVPESLTAFSNPSLHTDPTAWAPEVLASILPAGQEWQELARDMSDKLRAPAAQRSHKATAMILACASSEDCGEAAAALAVLPPRGEACSLVLNASKVAAGTDQPAAALQATLAPFLRRCPSGLVLLLEAQQLPVAAVPALHNALSELGGFQHDGVVDGSRAAYALLLQLPVQHVAAAAAAPHTSAADESIKEAFFNLQQQLLEQQQPAQQGAAAAEAWAVVSRSLKTLHRRIDFAAPVKLGTAAEDALDLAMQAAAAAVKVQQQQQEEEASEA